jgi:hypothetical protein
MLTGDLKEDQKNEVANEQIQREAQTCRKFRPSGYSLSVQVVSARQPGLGSYKNQPLKPNWQEFID